MKLKYLNLLTLLFLGFPFFMIVVPFFGNRYCKYWDRASADCGMAFILWFGLIVVLIPVFITFVIVHKRLRMEKGVDSSFDFSFALPVFGNRTPNIVAGGLVGVAISYLLNVAETIETFINYTLVDNEKIYFSNYPYQLDHVFMSHALFTILMFVLIFVLWRKKLSVGFGFIVGLLLPYIFSVLMS